MDCQYNSARNKGKAVVDFAKLRIRQQRPFLYFGQYCMDFWVHCKDCRYSFSRCRQPNQRRSSRRGERQNNRGNLTSECPPFSYLRACNLNMLSRNTRLTECQTVHFSKATESVGVSEQLILCTICSFNGLGQRERTKMQTHGYIWTGRNCTATDWRHFHLGDWVGFYGRVGRRGTIKCTYCKLH